MIESVVRLSAKAYGYMLAGAILSGASAVMLVRAGQQSMVDILAHLAKNPPLK